MISVGSMAARSGLRAGSALTIGVGGNELSKAIALLRSVGGRMYLPGLTSRVASDGSGGSPVAGDVIGWLPDRVSGANAATQSTTGFKPKLIREPILGPELVVNGDFSNGTTGWSLYQSSLSVSSGVAIVVAATRGGSFNVSRQLPSLVAGRSYVASAIRRNENSTGVSLFVQRGMEGGYASIANEPSNYSGIVPAVRSFVFTAPASDARVAVVGSQTAIGQSFVCDNISVREILGYTERYSLEFDGVDDRLFLANPNISLDAGVLLCAAITPLSKARGMPVFSARNASGAEGLQFGTDDSGIYVYISDGTPAQYPGSKVCNLGDTVVFTVWRDGNTWRVRCNGVSLGSVANTTVQIPPFAGFAIGGDARASYGSCNARVGFGAFTMGITTLEQVQTIERAAAQAAGITL